MGWSLVDKKKKSIPQTKNSSPKVDSKQEDSKINSSQSNDVFNVKRLSFTSLVEKMKPTAEELQYRKVKSMEPDVVQQYSKFFKCTKCQGSFRIGADKLKKIQTHPCLGVLMCQNCRDYYEDGEFSMDSEGEDKYCRWCGEGGTLFGCSKCPCGFCVNCIKRHFGIEYLKEVERDDDWLCFFCDSKPLWLQRFICSLAEDLSQKQSNQISSPVLKVNPSVNNESLKNSNGKKKQIKSLKRKRSPEIVNQDFEDSSSSTDSELFTSTPVVKKRKLFQKEPFNPYSSDDSDAVISDKEFKKLTPKNNLKKNSSQNKTQCFEDLKSNVLEKLESILKLSEYQLSFAVSWSTKTLKKLSNPNYIKTSEKLKNECEKIKWFLSLVSSCTLEYCTSIDILEKNLFKENGHKSDSPSPVGASSDYSPILQFLDFVTNQVNMFMKNGISLPNILQGEMSGDGKNTLFASSSGESKSSNSQKTKTKQNKRQSKNVSSHKEESQNEDKSSLATRVSESENTESEDEVLESSNTNSGDGNNYVNKDPKSEILRIMSILENA